MPLDQRHQRDRKPRVLPERNPRDTLPVYEAEPVVCYRASLVAVAVACCDFVFASDAASFGQPEVKFGSIPSLASLLLPPLIGSRQTIELILTGDIISAKDAQRVGLVYAVSPDGQLRDSVETLLNKFRRLSLPVSQLALESARSLRAHAMEEHLREAESLYLNRLMDLDDCAEGAKAFLEKRPPKWKNR